MNDKESQKNWLQMVLNKNKTPIQESLIALLAGVVIVAITIILDVICNKLNNKIYRVSNFYDVLMYPLIIFSFFLFVVVILLYKSINYNSMFLIYLQKAIVFIGGVLFILGFFWK